jgi:hypothetical protein
MGEWIPCKSKFCDISVYTEKDKKKLLKSPVSFSSDSALFFNKIISQPTYKIQKNSVWVMGVCKGVDYSELPIFGDSVSVLTVSSSNSINYPFVIKEDTLIINWDGLIIWMKKRKDMIMNGDTVRCYLGAKCGYTGYVIQGTRTNGHVKHVNPLNKDVPIEKVDKKDIKKEDTDK